MMMGLSCAAVQAGEGAKNNEAQIKQIQKRYDAIESDQSLKRQLIQAKTELPYEPKLIRFTDAEGELKKIQIELQSDHGFTHESYFFHQGRLFFIYAVDEYWQFVGADKNKTGSPETMDVGSQQRYYFEGDKCIRALEKQAETKQADQLRALLKKAENKPLEVGLGAAEYQQKAILVSKIKSVADLEKFIEQYTK